MKRHRVWLEIVLLSATVACALAFLIAKLGVAAAGHGSRQDQSLEEQSSREQSYEGMVTCSRCGAKHSANLGQTAADCARVCVHGGAQFALVEPDNSYFLDGDLNVLKKLAGQRVHILGELKGKTVKVSSAAAEI